MFNTVEKKINTFYEDTMRNYQSSNMEEEVTAISTPLPDEDDDAYKASSQN